MRRKIITKQNVILAVIVVILLSILAGILMFLPKNPNLKYADELVEKGKWNRVILYKIPYNEAKKFIYLDERSETETEIKEMLEYLEKEKLGVWSTLIDCELGSTCIKWSPKNGILEIFCNFTINVNRFSISDDFDSSMMTFWYNVFHVSAAKIDIRQMFQSKGCFHETAVLYNSTKREAYECHTDGEKVWYEKVDEGVDENEEETKE